MSEKVAILGGGMAALTAAYELARQVDDTGQKRYEVTVYQMGWRLGGKAATGRNLDEGRGKRIEEHGIHSFLGSYVNALRLMDEVFADLAATPGIQHVFTSADDAFGGHDHVVRWEFEDGRWQPWSTHYTKSQEPTAVGADQRLNIGLQGLVEDLMVDLEAFPNTWHSGERMAISAMARRQVRALGSFAATLRTENATDGRSASNAFNDLEKLREAQELAQQVLDGAECVNTEARRKAITADLRSTVGIGFIVDSIATAGFASIDEENYDEWLARHGAHERTRRSPYCMVTPNITYNFPDGDMTRPPRMSAGSFLQWVIGLSGFQRHFVMNFKAGSGESVMVPLYQALRGHGVTFRFFHKVRELRLNAERSRVARIEIDVQAQPAGAEYDPLVGPIKGLLCWPNRPKYEALQDGEALRAAGGDFESWWCEDRVGQTTLEAGTHFDKLVLGISLGALPLICEELLADTSNPPVAPALGTSRWKSMVDNVETVPTQAMQLWLNCPARMLLVDANLPADQPWLAGTFALPLSGQADNGHALPFEDWPAEGPGGLLYLCGPMRDEGLPLDDPDFPRRQRERVRWQCLQYLSTTSAQWLPGAATNTAPAAPAPPGALDYGELYCPPAAAGQLGEARFGEQYWRANIEPSERYVTCFPGAAKYRLKAGGSGYDNLFLAGDWIHTGLNVGSMEGACMGGRLASSAISGVPAPGDIDGYA